MSALKGCFWSLQDLTAMLLNVVLAMAFQCFTLARYCVMHVITSAQMLRLTFGVICSNSLWDWCWQFQSQSIFVLLEWWIASVSTTVKDILTTRCFVGLWVGTTCSSLDTKYRPYRLSSDHYVRSVIVCDCKRYLNHEMFCRFVGRHNM